MLIGSTCLALTDQERDTIENLNFSRYESSLDRDKRKDLSLRVAKKAGKCIGEDIGHETAIENETSSPEFVRWRDERYASVVLPDLSRYVKPDKESKKQLNCPITLDWMKEPVQAKDGHVYEKEAIIEHLIHWMERIAETLALRQIQVGAPFRPQEMQELLNTSSPLRNGYISISKLKELPSYYEETVKLLTSKYNMEVLKQRAIVDQTKNQTQELSEEVAKVVKFYSMTQKERNHIKTNMRRDLLVREVFRPDEQTEEDQALDLLTAAAKPPELIKLRV